jgi:hypothetical protein
VIGNVNLGQPDVNLSTLTTTDAAPGGRQISAAGSPRILQFALKLLF